MMTMMMIFSTNLVAYRTLEEFFLDRIKKNEKRREQCNLVIVQHAFFWSLIYLHCFQLQKFMLKQHIPRFSLSSRPPGSLP